MTLLQVLGSAILGGSFTAIGLTIAGYLARAQLAHWLNKDIERVKSDYQKELEADKASFQRELEAYKVSLIAQAERVKAEQDIKRTAALKILEMEFATLQLLHRETLGLGVELASAARKAKQYRSAAQFEKLSNRCVSLGDAVYSIAIFLTPEEQALLDRYEDAVLAVLLPFCEPGRDEAKEEFYPARDELYSAERSVEVWISEKLKSLRRLD
ncbi:hypothetical protein ABIC33_001276 [Variovorax sp. 1140]|uniref:hypothetical protein n=1 Tax=Variovorax atrisoli TaxID=3394203 RepID=UPI003399D3FB